MDELEYTAEQVEMAQGDSFARGFKEGYLDGATEWLTRYAWWKDGTQYVGSCGTTLKEALAQMRAEAKKL